jgi:hypothetical protein
MADGINPPRHATDNDEAACGEVSAKPLGQLCPIERGLARSDDADARQIQNLRIAADVKHDRGIIDLQQVPRIFGFGPVQQAAADDSPNSGKLLFGALEGFLLEDCLRHRNR